MIRIKKLLSFLAASLVLAATTPGFAQSSNQTSNGFRISPVRNEATIEKGASKTLSVMIENPSGVAIKAKAVVNDFVPSDTEDGQPRILLDSETAPSHSLKKLVQPIGDIELAANERKEVKVTVSIPKNAAAGGYYGAIRFVPSDSKNGGNVALTASVGSIFLINVPGNIKEHLELVQFSAAQNGKAKKIIFSGAVSVITRLKNDGDTHEKPFGKVIVKDAKGSIVASEEINNIEPQANVLPSSIRKFETKLSKSKWLGRYTVTASLGYNPSNGDLINAKTSFWYIPVWMVIVAALILAAVVIVIYWGYRKMSSRRKKSRPQI